MTQSDAYRKFQYKMVGTHRLSRYSMRYVMEILFSKKNFSVDYQNLLNYHKSRSGKISSIERQSFTLDFLISQKTDPLRSLPCVQIQMIKNMYLMLLSGMIYRKIKMIVCYFYCHMNFTSLVIKFLLIV